MLFKKVLHKLGINKSYTKRVQQSTFKVPIYNQLGFANFYTTEPWMEKMMAKLGSQDTKFLDIGANVGQTLMKWRSNFKTAPYLGVEPNLQCAAYVDRLIKLNNLTACEVIPVAVTNETQFLELFTSSTDPSDIAGTTVPNFREGQNTKGKKIVGLGYQLFDEFNPDIIKIDVEGAEQLIIEAIFCNPPKNNPVILCEILPAYNEQNTSRITAQNKIVSILHENNYQLFRIDTEKLSLNAIETIEIHGDLNQCEYLFVHQDQIENTLSKF